MPAALSFAATTGRQHSAVTVNATGLSAATSYNLVLTTSNGHTKTLRITTDGAGAASASFVPDSPGSFTAVVVPLATTATVSSSNTFTAV